MADADREIGAQISVRSCPQARDAPPGVLFSLTPNSKRR
jgi:hypothetical protein